MKPAKPPDPRAPHKATRDVVDVDGDALVGELYKRFDAMNAEHFGNKLAAPLVLVTPTSSPRAVGDATLRDPHGLRSVVRIAPKSLRRGIVYAADVLLHEMIHVWQYEILGDHESGYKGHGPRFAEKCNHIGDRLGLAPVGVKGRRGLPDCARWPLCVRPEGFYPPDPDEERRKAAADKRRAEKAASGGESDDAGDVVDEDLAGLQRTAIALACELEALEAEQRGDKADAKALRRSADYLRELDEAG